MPKERLLGKATSKIQIYTVCIEQNRKYLHSVVVFKTARKSNLQKNH